MLFNSKAEFVNNKQLYENDTIVYSQEIYIINPYGF